jgi:hypothetical protein
MAQKVSDGVIAHTLWLVLGGTVLLALPLVPGIASGSWTPDGAGIAAIAILMFAGPAVTSTVFRVLRPRAHIYEELPTGEKFLVERSMKTRKILMAIALGFYALGTLLALL